MTIAGADGAATTPRVLTVVDSDSYTKWGAAMTAAMPAGWDTSLVLLRTPALPSGAQLAAALAGSGFEPDSIAVLSLAGFGDRIARERPDVVVLAVRGPVVRVLARAILAAGGTRPVIVSGLSGISIPPTLNALYFRSRVDLVVLHSKREIADFAALAEELGIRQEFALATLPFLPPRRRMGTVPGGDIVFAAQAKVPKEIEDRERVLDWLIATARAHPGRRVVLKLRGLAGEAQTHQEKFPFDVLLGRRVVPENLVVSTAAILEHLETAAAFVTVSSTAAIEAMALGVPVLLLEDFGVDPRLINVVFEGSGLFADSTDLVAGRFATPIERWLDENYFHAPTDETWVASVEAALARRAAGKLELRPQYRGALGGRLRRVWDRKVALGAYDRSFAGNVAIAIGVPSRGTIRWVRRQRVRLLRLIGRAPLPQAPTIPARVPRLERAVDLEPLPAPQNV